MLQKEFGMIDEKEQFTVKINNILNDKRISFKAKSIFLLIQSYPSNWKFRFQDLVDSVTDGKDSVLSGLRELESAGYLKRVVVRNEIGRPTHSIYHLSYTKEFKNNDGEQLNW